ncbi:N-acetylglucosamine-6-phosphate deacetylase [Nocardioides euryhalodurans]|uniref:N-acetylglucosamine-6-phosphate deacetylase n=1 Tax=Nocardioides euryhalodurans TaxID=2518370 RepID=A0A4P7GLX7_9ACTN|nr:N-acetylglucosamine-6-phosphate deacetylase [Nocardioides euryhalodurans]QBR93145.1 N-acetylglucosamine-6-phosphate deacetylase [Nocardioides euryhalodurans]
MADLVLRADRLVAPDRVLAPGWVHVVGGTISDVGAGAPPRVADVDLVGSTLVPGLVDSHVHGGGGAAFDGGDPAAVEQVVRAHRAQGTTTLLASLVTDTVDGLVRSAGRLADLVDDGLLAGVHLEGPWLSPHHPGAHDPALLGTPTAATVDRLVEAARGHLRMVTLAPELPGATEAVRRLVAAGVVVAIGHTDATYDQARAALDAGAAAGTHLFNAMRGLHHREPGPVAALLEHPDAHVELIADGVHVHPAMIGLAAAAKPHHTVLVTDAMAAAAAEDGDYRLGALGVEVRDGVARLPGGALAGSTATLATSVRYAVRAAGLRLEDAVRAATATPAGLHGLARTGALRPGADADLVALDEDLRVRRVMHRGRWIC